MERPPESPPLNGKSFKEVNLIKKRISRAIFSKPENYPNVTGIGIRLVDSHSPGSFAINVYLYNEPTDEGKYRKEIAGIPVVYTVAGVITAL